MREVNLVRKQPLSVGDTCFVIKVGEEEGICVFCDPKTKCKGNCKRYKEEIKKIKEKKRKKTNE